MKSNHEICTVLWKSMTRFPLLYNILHIFWVRFHGNHQNHPILTIRKYSEVYWKGLYLRAELWKIWPLCKIAFLWYAKTKVCKVPQLFHANFTIFSRQEFEKLSQKVTHQSTKKERKSKKLFVWWELGGK